MRLARLVTGLLGGLLLVASSGMHTFLGWPAQHVALEGIGASEDLIHALGLGWQFGGVAMVAFGLIAIWSFAELARRRPVSLVPAAIIGVLYSAYGFAVAIMFGVGALSLTFIVPGAMLLLASIGPVRDGAAVPAGIP